MGSSNWCSLNRDVNKSVCSLWCGGLMFDCGISSEAGSTGLLSTQGQRQLSNSEGAHNSYNNATT